MAAMPTVSPGAGGGRVQIAIASPEILAHIRREFAAKGLDVRVEGPPTVEVVVTPRAGTAPGAATGALAALAAPHAHLRRPASARYRLGMLAGPPPSVEDRRPALSPRESEVMEAISRGLRNADIATLLQVQQKTVKNHVRSIFTKLGAGSRVEAVLIWQRASGA
jgi:DNA-binding CsgD family transcriptional regulator